MQEKSGEKCSHAARLDYLRVTQQVTWADIAVLIGLSESMLYQVKNGKKNLSSKAIYRLEQAEREAGIGIPVQAQSHLPEPETIVRDTEFTVIHDQLARIELMLGRIADALEKLAESR